MTACAVLCKFKRDQDPSLAPELYPCQMAWMTDHQLLVGWADRINMCNIRQKVCPLKKNDDFFDPRHFPNLRLTHIRFFLRNEHSSNASSRMQDEEMRRTQSSPTGYYLEISSIFTTDDIFVCGLAPCGSNIAILGTEKVDGRDNTSQILFQLLEPHNKYCTQVSFFTFNGHFDD